MGTLRLVLAVLVLLSHADFRVMQLNPGVMAVVGFYLISGYVMAGLVYRHYASPERIPLFYVDRVMRLAPQYLLYAGLTVAWWALANPSSSFLSRAPSALDWFNNLLVVPLNFYMVNGSDGFTLIPPAWSLGAELQFYLVAPLMLLWPRVGLVLCAGSVVVQVLAWHAWLHTDWFGYRLLPGVLCMFGCGMLLFHWHQQKPGRAVVLAWAAPALALAVFAYLRARGLHAAPYHQEVLIGWGLGILLVHLMARRSGGAWDAWAGDTSYGVFLNHFLLIGLLFPQPARTPAQWLVLVVCSVVLSAITQRWVEQPVLRLRRGLRQSPRRGSPAAPGGLA